MRFTLALLLCSGLWACSDTSEPILDGGTGDTSVGDAGPDAMVDEVCEATFIWYQKDAYRETAGRGSDFWPPHTTTAIEVTCPTPDGSSELVTSTSRNNHGTAPEDLDPTGVMVLELVRQETAAGTRAELSDLVTAFEACECGTTFMSMDELSDSVVEELVGELAGYLTANLTCPGAGGTGAVVDALVAGDIERVLTLGAECTWSTDRSWEEGFDDALGAVIAVSSGVLADYHVCNNDAELQAELWAAFRTSGAVAACDASSPLCSGPRWFYAP